MANCSECGRKLGFLDRRDYVEDKGILCRYCYSNYTMKQERTRDEKRKEKIKREKKRNEEQIRMAVERKKAEESKWNEMDLGKLIENLGSSNVQSRVYAAKFIGRTKDRRAVTPLIEALKDREEKVVMGAVEGLGKIGDPRAVDDLRNLYKRYNKEFQKVKHFLNRKYPSTTGWGKEIAGAKRLKRETEKIQKAIDNLKEVKFKRMAKVIEGDLKEIDWQNFEDTVTDALNAVPSDTRTSDMGIDGITSDGVPIQIKQSEGIGRNVVDNFETALRRYYPSNKRNKKGIIVAFSFTKGAYTEADRARREDNIEIQLIRAELVD